MVCDIRPSIHSTTGVLCVIGHPIAHSLSPRMHNAAIAALGMDLCYVAFDVPPEKLGHAVQGMRGLGIIGMNVTVPHKQAVVEYIDEISDEARLVGAVNTVKNEGGRLVGFNTDVYGILKSLEDAGLSVLPKQTAVLGASGAARGVVYALASRPEVESVFVFNRTLRKAEEMCTVLAEATRKKIYALPLEDTHLRKHLGECGLLINATSVGMHPDVDASPLPDASVLHSGLVVYDAVFNPRTTKLLKQAQERGCRTVSGIGMLVHQGAKSFEIWTGIQPPVDVMKQAVGACD
ncbi:MAG: shikimate dehydrogenase [Armatimonadota bacterium]